MNRQITEHFSYAELTRSKAAVDHGLSNDVPPYLMDNLRRTAEALEEIRAHFGKPVLVTSCYRSPEVNRAIGGSLTSAHRSALAADFTVEGVPNLEVIQFIYYHLPDFDQVIEEFGQWIHLGLALKAPRRQALTAVKVDGKTKYKPGIEGVMA